MSRANDHDATLPSTATDSCGGGSCCGSTEPVAPAVDLTPSRIAQLQRRVRMIVAFTIAYNVIEAILSLYFGADASSGALLSFGLDSVVEVASAAVIVWQFSRPDPEKYERKALYGIAIAFFILAAYAFGQALLYFAGYSEPEPTKIGIAIAVASVIVMPLMSWFERRTGQELGSAAVVADSKQMLLCCYLSVALLVGLLLHAAFGITWADPIAGVVIGILALREGKEAWEGDACCTGSAKVLVKAPQPGEADSCGSSCCGD